MLHMRETMRWTIPILPLVVALGVSVTGCASIRAHQTAETEQILAAAGFQVEPADTPEKLAHLQTLTPRKVVQDVRDGQPQYVYADPQTCKCLYVGDEQRYQKFQELSLQKKIADEQRSFDPLVVPIHPAATRGHGMAKVVTYGVGTPLEVILTEQDGRSLADRITPVRLAR